MGGVGVGPEVAAAAGERWRVRRRLDFGFFKKREKESCYKTATACLNNRLGFCLLVRSLFLAIKEAGQFCLTFILQRSFKRASFLICTCRFNIGGVSWRAPVAGLRRPPRSRRFH